MKKKAISLLLALVLCMGMTVPALAAEKIKEITITVPGLDGFKSIGVYPDTWEQFETTVEGLTITMKNAPSEYWYRLEPNSTYGNERYIFLVQEDFRVSTNHLLTATETASISTYFPDSAWEPSKTISFENKYNRYWNTELGCALYQYSIWFTSDGFWNDDTYGKQITITFAYVSPEGILDLDAPGNEYEKADYEYDGIIDNNDGTGGLPRMVIPSRAPDKHGFESRSTAELAVGNTATPVHPIAEVPSSWAAEFVSSAIADGLVPEGLQGKYTQAATRAEFCALAVALYETATGDEITGREQFDDTTDVNVEKMAYLAVVNGVGEKKFAPGEKLTREQAATMLSRLANAMGKPLDGQAATFADSDSASVWAAESIGQMQATGVMSGVGNNTFAPKSDYTREQSIITMTRLFEIVK